MTLLLVQHGESLAKAQDPSRGLSPTGITTTERMAELAAEQGVLVDRVLHSGKKRARQTADIMAAKLLPEGAGEAVKGIDPLDDPSAFAATLDNRDRCMVVGHLPFLERLAALLITGSAERPVCRFQNAGIVCLDLDPDAGGWVIEWMLTPGHSKKQ